MWAKDPGVQTAQDSTHRHCYQPDSSALSLQMHYYLGVLTTCLYTLFLFCRFFRFSSNVHHKFCVCVDICIIIQFISVVNGSFRLHRLVKGKGNVRPRTGMESHRGRRGAPLIFNFGAIWNPRSGLEGCGKSQTHRQSIPRPSSPSELLYRLS